jgi:hypothetical protein
LLEFPDPALDVQLDVVLASQKFSGNNRTFVQLVMSPTTIQDVSDQLIVMNAARYELQANGFYGCVCVLSPNDTCANPPGMAPFCGNPSVGYAFTYASPHLIGMVAPTPAILYDQLFYFTPSPTTFVTVNAGSPLTVYFSAAYTITNIRLYTAYPLPAITMYDTGGDVVCQYEVPTFPATTEPFAWTTITCATLYAVYDLSAAFPNQYLSNCGANPSSATCLQWQIQTCALQPGPGVFWDISTSLAVYPGCEVDTCCIPIHVVDSTPSTTVKLVVTGSDTFNVQELQVYGYQQTAVSPPTIFQEELTYLGGTPVCSALPDYLYVGYTLAQYIGGDLGFIQDKTYYMPGDPTPTPTPGLTNPFGTPQSQPLQSWFSALGYCQNTAGFLANKNSIFDEFVTYGGEPVGASSELGASVAASGLSYAWTDGRNTQQRSLATGYTTTADFFLSTCTSIGCRHLPNPYGLTAVYAAKFPVMYEVPIVGGQTSWLQWMIGSSTGTVGHAYKFDFGAPLDLVSYAIYYSGLSAEVSNYLMYWGSQYQEFIRKFDFMDNPANDFAGEREYITSDMVHCALTAYAGSSCTGENMAAYSVHVGPSQTASAYLNSMGANGAINQVGIGPYSGFETWGDGDSTQFSWAAHPTPQRTISSFQWNNAVNCRLCITGNTFYWGGDPAFSVATYQDCVAGSTSSGDPTFFVATSYSTSDEFFSEVDNRCFNFPTIPTLPPAYVPGFPSGSQVLSLLPHTNFVHVRVEHETAVYPQTGYNFGGPLPSDIMGITFQDYMCEGINTQYLFWTLQSTGHFYVSNTAPVNFLGDITAIPVCVNAETCGAYFPMLFMADWEPLFVPCPPPLSTDYLCLTFDATSTYDWSGLTTPSIPNSDTITFTACSTIGYTIPSCLCCALESADAFFEVGQEIYPVTGDTFLDIETAGLLQTTACSVKTINPMVVDVGDNQYHGGTMLTNIHDGLIQMYALSTNPNYGPLYAKINAWFDITMFNEYWFFTDCLAVDAQSYILAPYPCYLSLNTLCQFNWTPFCAQPGMVCNRCGDSARISGAARPNQTCQVDFDLASDIFGSLSYQVLYGNQNFSSLISGQLDELCYNEIRAMLNNGTFELFWFIPGASPLFLSDLSTLSDRLSVDATADPVYGTDFSVSEIWPVDCGEVSSLGTGVTQEQVSALNTRCSVQDLNTDQIGVALPSLRSTLGYDPQCTTMIIHPYLFFFPPPLGSPALPSSYFNNFIVQSGSTTYGVDLLVKQTATTFSVYNTFQSELDFQFYASVEYTLYATAWCPLCFSPISVSVWISPPDYYGMQPSGTQKQTIGTFFSSKTQPNPPNNVFVFQVPTNGTWSIVGFDVSQANQGNLLTIGNIFITTNASLTRCATLVTPIFQPKTSVQCPVLDNECVTTNQQRIDRQADAIGDCSCDGLVAGSACNIPAFSTLNGEQLGFGGYGELGQGVTPYGNTVPISTNPADRGLMVDNGQVFAWVVDFGRVLWTVLTKTTLDYPLVYRVDSTYGADDFVLATSANGLLPWNTLQLAIAIDYALKAVLPSILNADELQEFLALLAAANITQPVFMDIQQNSPELTGNSNWMWATRGMTFIECQSALDGYLCGESLPAVVVCNDATNALLIRPRVWAQEICDAINTNNLVYETTTGGNAYLTDGSWVAGPSVTSATVGVVGIGAYTVQVWWTSLGVEATIPSCVSVPLALTNGGYVSPPGGTPIAFLGVWTCTTTTPTASFTVTFTSSTSVYEIQVYHSQDTVRSPFYPIVQNS